MLEFYCIVANETVDQVTDQGTYCLLTAALYTTNRLYMSRIYTVSLLKYKLYSSHEYLILVSILFYLASGREEREDIFSAKKIHSNKSRIFTRR